LVEPAISLDDFQSEFFPRKDLSLSLEGKTLEIERGFEKLIDFTFESEKEATELLPELEFLLGISEF